MRHRPQHRFPRNHSFDCIGMIASDVCRLNTPVALQDIVSSFVYYPVIVSHAYLRRWSYAYLQFSQAWWDLLVMREFTNDICLAVWSRHWKNTVMVTSRTTRVLYKGERGVIGHKPCVKSWGKAHRFDPHQETIAIRGNAISFKFPLPFASNKVAVDKKPRPGS